MRLFKAIFSVVLTLPTLLAAPLNADDWPAWRHDAQRSAVTSEKLPEALPLQWSTTFPVPQPAWSDSRLQFDEAYQPVIVGKTLYFGSSSFDALVAVDTETGKERWRFHAQGPIRTAPAIAQGRVYFGSDDGYLYCVDATSGKLFWKFFGAHSPRKVLGNERLISMWPVRGGPVIADGVVYFASGIWPFMGIFVHALDAESGQVLWTNEKTGTVYGDQSGATTGAFGGASPQGSIVISGKYLVIPTGRAWPVFVDRATGEMQPYAAGIKDTAGGGDSRVAVSGDYLMMGGWMVARSEMRAIIFNSDANATAAFTTVPLIEDEVLYCSTPDAIEVHDLKDAKFAKVSGAYGRPLVRCDTRPLWSAPVDKQAVSALMKAGPRLYAGRTGEVFSIDIPSEGTDAAIGWKAEIEGTPVELAVADGKLFVSTKEGRLYCFSGTQVVAVNNESLPKLPSEIQDSWSQKADQILKRTGVKAGYAYVLGLENGRLVEELVRRSDLRVIAVDENPEITDALRKRLAASGLLGPRVSVFTANPLNFGYPPYIADLIVSERPAALELDSPKDFLDEVYPGLRPYGGVLCLERPPEKLANFASYAESAALENAHFERDGALMLLTRQGALPGAADWSSEAGLDNTRMSRDQRVRAPLGITWFGGPAGEDSVYLARHSDPPSARICGGRMFIHGSGIITAVDAYTGRILWKRTLSAEKPFANRRSYVETNLFPGTYTDGSQSPTAQLFAHPQGLCVAYGSLCEVWDPATGETLREITIPSEKKQGEDLYFGQIKVLDNVLIAGAEYSRDDIESPLVALDFADAAESDIRHALDLLDQWPPAKTIARSEAETDIDFLVRRLNRLLTEDDLDKSVPAALTGRVKASPDQAQAVQKAIADIDDFRQRSRSTYNPYLSLESVNRRLIEAYFPSIRKNPPQIYWHNLFPWDGEYTQQLAGLDRESGKMLWRINAKYSFPQESVAVGNGKVFCIDRVDLDTIDYMRRRGTPLNTEPRILALDAQTGKTLWSETKDVHGYKMFYSPERDLLVRISTFDSAPQYWWSKPRQLTARFIVCRGTDGELVWDYTLELNRQGGGHRMWYDWILHKDTIILESYFDNYADYYGFDLLTGERLTRRNPLTEAEIPWGFKRTYGCAKNVCSENLVLFRSGTAGYYNIENDGGTGSLGGFRTGCKNSLIPGDGLLNAPNYASGCTCNYPVFTALAMAYMPEVESWSTNDYAWGGEPIKRLGINLGAPGDRRADSGTLWLDYPSVGGDSPDIPIKTIPQNPHWLYRHSSRLAGQGLNWVGASGVEGLTAMTLTLSEKPVAEQTYTIRLYFAETEEVQPGERVFSVAIQEKTVIERMDIAHEAGGAKRLVVKEFTGIKAGQELELTLKPVIGQTLLSGIELIAQ